MSVYVKLIQNPPKFNIKENPKELIFHLVSCMCDNRYTIRLKKNHDGEFKLSGMGYSLSNYSFKHEVYEIEWEADEGEWGGVIAMINSGTSVIEKISSR